jgi:hypothetical protein
MRLDRVDSDIAVFRHRAPDVELGPGELLDELVLQFHVASGAVATAIAETREPAW